VAQAQDALQLDARVLDASRQGCHHCGDRDSASFAYLRGRQ
jgi:hypothetical protein